MTHADTAHKLVIGCRNESYGPPDADFAGIALMWTGLLNTVLKRPLTKVDVALMMTALKLRRHAHKPSNDNLIDAHGYLTCLEWIESGQKPEPEAAGLWQTIEDVATGTRLNCTICNKPMPCMCGHAKQHAES